MTEEIITKAKNYKSQGFEREKIWQYLKNSGHSEIEIKMALSQMDSDEIHELYLNQQLSAARNQVIVSLVIFAVGLIYNVYNVSTGNGINSLTFVIPIGIVGVAYFRFKSIKSKRYSTSKIIKDNRQHDKWK